MLTSLKIKSSKLESLLCQNNALKNPVTEEIINSLPKSEETKIAVMMNNSMDKYEVSKQSIAAAFSKNWMILDQAGNKEEEIGVSFEGKDYTDITDVTKTLVLIYPNPVVDYAYVKGAEANQPIKIYTIRGILTKIIVTDNRGEAQINVSNFQNGTYIFFVNNQAFKIIKK